MKELLAIIIVLLIYIAIQLTTKTLNQPVSVQKTSKKYTEIPKISQVIHTNPPHMTFNNPHSHSMTHPPNHVPINIPTRGPSEQYKQIGVLTNSDNSKNLPLYGKRVWCGASKWLYYTQTDKFVSVHLPVYKNGRDCSAEYGCDELFDQDEVTVRQFNETFTVTLYHTEGPRYIPYIHPPAVCY